MTQTTAQTPKKRFASRTEEEILKLLKEKDSKNTQQVTKNAVKTLREFCKFEAETEDFEKLPKSDLNKLLRRFYANTRKQDKTS